MTGSAQQQEIIEHPSSCYVIGRSGTGKTTTMLFKMLGIQRAWQQDVGMRPKPRQVFITQSGVLATKVEEFFSKLTSSLEVTECPSEEPHMMEGAAKQDIEFLDLDDVGQWRSDLPERFSELLDDHFPLFISYDRVQAPFFSECLISPLRQQLCTMLQNDIQRDDRSDDFIIPKMHAPRNFVSYGGFLALYWPHLHKTLTRELGEE